MDVFGLTAYVFPPSKSLNVRNRSRGAGSVRFDSATVSDSPSCASMARTNCSCCSSALAEPKALISGKRIASSECSRRGDRRAQASRSVLHAATQVKRIGRSTNAMIAPSTSSGKCSMPQEIRGCVAAGSLGNLEIAGAAPAPQSARSRSAKRLRRQRPPAANGSRSAARAGPWRAR